MPNSKPDFYRGLPVPKHPRIYLRINHFEWKKVIDAKLDFKLSAKEAILQGKVFCDLCQGIQIKKYQ